MSKLISREVVVVVVERGRVRGRKKVNIEPFFGSTVGNHFCQSLFSGFVNRTVN